MGIRYWELGLINMEEKEISIYNFNHSTIQFINHLTIQQLNHSTIQPFNKTNHSTLK